MKARMDMIERKIREKTFVSDQQKLKEERKSEKMRERVRIKMASMKICRGRKI